MQTRSIRTGLLAALAAQLCGCATTTPDFRRGSESPQQQWLSQQKLIYHIQCQLATAVADAVKLDAVNAPTVPAERRALWLADWGAKVSLVLSINNKSSLAPGITFNDPLENAVTVFSQNGNVTTPQSRSLGLGFTWSADATRTESIGFYYSFKDLLALPIDTEKCKPSNGPYLSSDLKISDFLSKGIDISLQPDALIRTAGTSPYSTFTYQVKFIVTNGGSVTPGWKLVALSANQSGNLFAASKIRTDDLTITMGKVENKDGNTTPSAALEQQHLANLIGQSVSNALQGRPLQ